MLSNHAASDRATRMAVATGNAVNLHIIQATQQAEGFDPCFGRAVAECNQTQCTYHDKCMTLVAFDAEALHLLSDVLPASRRMPAATLVHPQIDRTHRILPAADYGFAPLPEADANS